MRASFVKASLAGLAALGAVASFSPAQAQEDVALNQCYDDSIFTQMMAQSGQVKIVEGAQVVVVDKTTTTLPINFYFNPADKTGYVVKYDGCTPDQTNVSANAPIGVKPILKLHNAVFVDKKAPQINERIKALNNFNDTEALTDCAQIKADECGSFNQKIDIATSNNIGIMMQSQSTLLKGDAYVPGPIVTISADVGSSAKGAMLISRPSGATLLRMLFTKLDYTNDGLGLLKAPGQVASARIDPPKL